MAGLTREQREAKRKEGRETTGRSERIPVGVQRSKLSFPVRQGYVRRVVNDSEGNLDRFLNGGYEFVQKPGSSLGDTDVDNVNRDLGSFVSRVVDKTSGKKAYLMEIKEEFYKEDQALKSKAVAEVDRKIAKGKIEDGDGRYIPDQGQGITIETRNT